MTPELSAALAREAAAESVWRELPADAPQAVADAAHADLVAAEAWVRALIVQERAERRSA